MSSLIHRLIQNKLLQALSKGQKEYPFPSIKRIADIVYFPQKIVFEVQCSPITLEDVQKRNHDYGLLGFSVIWILHTQTFNKETLTPAERYLRQKNSYYCSLTPSGQGIFYDQWECFKGMKRSLCSSPFTLDYLIPYPLGRLPQFFPKKLKERTHYLKGDVVDSLIRSKKGRSARIEERKIETFGGLKKRGQELFYSLLRAQASSSHTDREGQNRG